MDKAQILHRAAMDFYDIGRVARAKGKQEIFDEYLPIAFVLEKEAAYLMQTISDDSLWKSSYARSAAWIAVECGLFEEAKKLAQLGLSASPPSHEKFELEEVLKKANEKIINYNEANFNNFQIKGTLTAINVDKGQILIRENGKKEYQVVILPENYDHRFIGTLIGRLVEIKAKKNKQYFILENIRLAA